MDSIPLEDKNEVAQKDTISPKIDKVSQKSSKDTLTLNIARYQKLIPQDRDIIDLIQNSDSVIVVSYEKMWNHRNTEDSIKILREKVKLTPQQRILFVKTLNKYAKITIKQVKTDCWYPHHTVYFCTKEGIAYWDICFHCNRDESVGISFLNASNVRLEKNGIIAKLFKKFGLTYQL